jgi:threonine aldolase
MGEEFIDLRSDTVTLPTEEMREAMRAAEVGDAMRGEDPTINRLEALAAKKVGKEAAIFVPSGTMGNLISLMGHTNTGDEVILEADSHIYYYEVGGFAAVAGLSPRLVRGDHGYMDPVTLETEIRPSGPFFPSPRLLCIENTHNRGGGNALKPSEMKAMAGVARRHNMAVHLDGARIFNAAVALGVDVKELTACVDSVMFCLSKGLSAPVGSIVAGGREFMDRAKRARKMLGGDMRQSGVLAAAGIVALEKMVDRLAQDVANAALLAEGLRELSGIVLDTPPVPTNMVFIRTHHLGMDSNELGARLRERKILCTCYGPYLVRLVTHRHIRREHIEPVVEAVWQVSKGVNNK